MPRKKKRTFPTWILYAILAGVFVILGIAYARFERGGVQEILPEQIRSQTLQQPQLSEEKIQQRIQQLSEEILQATNDPQRALMLRREVQKLKEELGQ